MAIPIDELVEQVKQANRIESVIAKDFAITGHGRRLATAEHPSLQIDVDRQEYWWWSKGNDKDSHGDVINWVMSQNGWDFKTAIEHLCHLGNVAAPDWSKQDSTTRMTTRQREDALTVASDVFHKWLLADAAALDYCHGRGWTDETIQRTRLGFTGNKTDTDKLRKEMMDAFGVAGVDPRCPAAVAVIGFKGDVKHWGIDYEVKPDQAWVEKDYIHGVVGWGSVVYSHMFAGRCTYIALRKLGEKEHHNLNSLLVGERRIFTNSRWSKSSPLCVVVEGQADAITLDQWEIPAVALCGVAATDSLGKMLACDDKNKRAIFYLGLDSDKAGSFDSFVSDRDTGPNKKANNTVKVAKILGPMTYILEWGRVAQDVIKGLKADDAVKDANDILKVSIQKKMDPEKVAKEVGSQINACRTVFVNKFAQLAGMETGARRDEAIKAVVEVIAVMDDMTYARTQKDLAKCLDVDQRELKNMVKAIAKEEKKKDDLGDNVEYIMGGYIKGWLVESMYDPEDLKMMLAWREPNGRIDTGYTVTIDAKKYAAMPPTETIMKGGVAMASKLGALKETRELAKLIEGFVNRVYLLPNPLFAKIISYYVLLTWVYDSYPAIPYLRATGEPGSGKSELMKRIGMLCYRTMSSSGASSTSSLFRMVERYKGTVLMDEMDLRDSGASADIIKFLTQGAMEDGPIYRTEKVVIDGKEEFQETMFQTFCPKLIGMQGDFFDKAVGTRCITFQVEPRETYELRDAGIPLERTKAMKAEALAIRNLLLHWRLVNWQPQREINPDFYNENISARLNQVTVAIQMIAENDVDLRKEINHFMNEYYLYLQQDKAMSVEARIIEALWTIYKFPDTHQQMVITGTDGTEQIKVGNVKNIANTIMKFMNMDEGDEEEDDSKSKRKKKDAISAQMVGRRLRDKLHMPITNRTSEGFYVIWDEKRLVKLSRSYGVNPDDLGPREGVETYATSSNDGKPVQKTAVKPVAKKVEVQDPLIEGGE